MKKYQVVGLALAMPAFLLLSSCGLFSKKPPAIPTSAPAVPSPPPAEVYAPAPVPPEFTYEKNAIRLHLKSDPKLNVFQGNPHTLLICVYNLKDPNGFNQQIGEKEGLPKLLECGRFDGTVASAKRLVIQPGQEVNESFDRAEGAKYVGLVAGYFTLQKENVTRLFPVPILEETEGTVVRKKIFRPGVLNLELYLGPHEIEGPKGK